MVSQMLIARGSWNPLCFSSTLGMNHFPCSGRGCRKSCAASPETFFCAGGTSTHHEERCWTDPIPYPNIVFWAALRRFSRVTAAGNAMAGISEGRCNVRSSLCPAFGATVSPICSGLMGFDVKQYFSKHYGKI